MAITWTDDLATGSPEIDGHHKEIFVRINSLLDACSRGRGRQEVGSVFAFLEDYVRRHFAAEERWMVKQRYEGHAAHKAQHDEFITRFLELKRVLGKDGPGIHIVVATNQLLVDWFLNHIRKVDTQLGAFLRDAR